VSDTESNWRVDVAASGGSSYLTPEARARVEIDRMLQAAGWVVQDYKAMNLMAARAVAIREFPTATGPADYLLYVDRKAIGTIEAKKPGITLRGVETQADRYAEGFKTTAEQKELPAWGEPLPFHYMSTGKETLFTSRLDPISRPREVFHFHRGEHLVHLVKHGSLRQGIHELKPLVTTGLRPSQIDAINGLERSLRDDRPRALVTMATGAGKTIMAAAHAYRLLSQGKAERILFLVDRRNLGRQARDAISNWQTPDDGRKFGELYPVQRLDSNTIDPAAKVVITTIQRLYSILRGDEAFGEEREEHSGWESGGDPSEAIRVSYQPKLPVEFFDYIIIDECHRSIYGQWGQVLDYFDAHLTGLTATAARETYAYFSTNIANEAPKPNVVSEYSYEQSVVDGVNVDYIVYRIKTEISERGSTIAKGNWVEVRDKQTRAKDRQALDEDFDYDESKLDTAVIAVDQIRTVVRAFKEGLAEMFPGRETVPKTVFFCKDDSHAEDVLKIIREEFAEGSSFAKKITYRTEGSSEQAIQDFRTDPRFRIAVTVDQVSTGTDIKPIECLVFMRRVKSRLLFEQMRGRGVRTINPNDLQAVSPGASTKTHFVLVDAVGITDDDTAWVVSPPLDREPSTPLKALLQRVAEGSTSHELLSTIAARLKRIERRLEDNERAALNQLLGGHSLGDVAANLIRATSEETWRAKAVEETGDEDPSDDAITEAKDVVVGAAVEPLLRGDVREAILGISQRQHQIIDTLSTDSVISAGIQDDGRAREMLETWTKFIEENRDEYIALAAVYSEPQHRRMTLKDVKELAAAISMPPHNLTPDLLWRAYEKVEKNRVRGHGGKQIVDLVSLVRFATEQDDELTPLAEVVRLRFQIWMTEQEGAGRVFTDRQRLWLSMIAEHIANSLTIEREDFDLDPFRREGGLIAAHDVFGTDLDPLLEELNEKLVVV
jgi:type I restriction enzyme R subunit